MWLGNVLAYLNYMDLFDLDYLITVFMNYD